MIHSFGVLCVVLIASLELTESKFNEKNLSMHLSDVFFTHVNTGYVTTELIKIMLQWLNQ